MSTKMLSGKTDVKPFYQTRRDLNTASLKGRKHKFTMTRLNSKVVKFAGYCENRNELVLILRVNEGKWAPYFYRVSKATYSKLLSSASPGVYLNNVLKGQTTLTTPLYLNWNYVQQLVKELSVEK